MYLQHYPALKHSPVQAFFLYFEKMVTGSAAGGDYYLPTTLFQNYRQWRQTVMLHEEILTGEEQLILDHLVLIFFLDIRGSFSKWKTESDASGCKDFGLSQIIDYMRANLSEHISLDELVQIARCTSFHIIRLFKTRLGMSPHAYLMQLRLEQARQHIDASRAIVDAALVSGFSDQSHLTRLFSKRYGLTPGRYLAQESS
jgi:AraC-like DNA-binding protein